MLGQRKSLHILLSTTAHNKFDSYSAGHLPLLCSFFHEHQHKMHNCCSFQDSKRQTNADIDLPRRELTDKRGFLSFSLTNSLQRAGQEIISIYSCLFSFGKLIQICCSMCVLCFHSHSCWLEDSIFVETKWWGCHECSQLACWEISHGSLERKLSQNLQINFTADPPLLW